MPFARYSVVATFATHDQGEEAIREPQQNGVDMKELSIVGKDCHTEENVVGYYNTCERMAYWGEQGAFWGGLWGLLFGSAFFWVLGVGSLLLTGPLVMWMACALEGAAMTGGINALGGGLSSIGITKDSFMQSAIEVKNDKLLLVAHGSSEDVARARDILDRTDASTTTFHGKAVAVGT